MQIGSIKKATVHQLPGRTHTYAVLIALLAFGWQYLLFKQHGLIVMLFLASWTVLLWNSVWPQGRFKWV